MQRGNYNPHTNPFQTHKIHQISPQIPRNPPNDNPCNPPLNHPIHHLPPPQYPFSPEYERILRDEVIYLHSLWHRGPPSSTLNPNSQTPHYLKPSIPSIFKKTQKTSKSLEPHLIFDKEWPVESIPKCPSSSASIWPKFKPQSAPASRPATSEEKERVLSLKIHLKGLDCCSELFDSDNDDDDEEDDGDDVEEFEYFMKVFEEQEELRGYYKKNCENGEFYCLVCGALAGKLSRKYKNCVAVVQHSVTISSTKKRKAHRAFGHVICKILGWDVHRLPSLPSKDGGAGSQSLEKSCVFPGDNHADGSKDSPAAVEREGDFANVSAPNGRVLTVAFGSGAAGGSSTPQPQTQGMALAFEHSWPLGPIRFKSQATQSGDSSASRRNIDGAYANYLTGKSVDVDTSRWPDLQTYAKRMIRTLTRSEKEAVPGMGQVNIDWINSLLVEVMLRVDGLRTPLRKKQEEVRDAQRRATELIDVHQYNSLMFEIQNKAREMKQDELLRNATAAADAANKKAADFEQQRKGLQADVKKLTGADKENAKLKDDVARLKGELAKSQTDFQKKLEAEQGRLIDENERDCGERMKMVWSMIHPETEYAFFDLRYQYASAVYDARALGIEQPAPFEEWAGLGEPEEHAENEVPDGAEAQVQHDQEAPIPGQA